MVKRWMTACFCLAAFALAQGAAAEVPRPEHPRPDLMRGAWQNLNGEWEFEFDVDDRGQTEGWSERDALASRIVVPFPVESELSGVTDTDPPPVCWYLRRFTLDPALAPNGGRVLLHFGAVDYLAQVWLNGALLGEHVGGYTPFAFDVTAALKAGENRLALRVFDAKDKMQVRGKQTSKAESYMISYTKVTGIWQTVWLERVGDPHVVSYRFTPDPDLGGGRFSVELSNPQARGELELSPLEGGGVAETVALEAGEAHWRGREVKPWSPSAPNLYRVRFRVRGPGGGIADEVESYVGVRTVAAQDGQVLLNGAPFYQKLLLDQGYFPGGVYTPADDAIMVADLEMYKRMGFNGLRKHQKLEDPRFLYWCDRLGLVVWEEGPSFGFGVPRGVPQWAFDRFRDEWLAAIQRDFNHPAIITWTIFNENWGIYEMLTKKQVREWGRELARLTRAEDPTRLMVDNSGGFHFDTDVFDFHHYLPTAAKSRQLYRAYDFKPGQRHGPGWYLLQNLKGVFVIPNFFPGVPYQGQPIILSEYGGFGYYPTEGEASLLDLYRDYTLAIGDFPSIQGFCYTQPYDVEQEQNGLMTFDRVPKVDPDEIRAINDQVGF